MRLFRLWMWQQHCLLWFLILPMAGSETIVSNQPNKWARNTNCSLPELEEIFNNKKYIYEKIRLRNLNQGLFAEFEL